MDSHTRLELFLFIFLIFILSFPALVTARIEDGRECTGCSYDSECGPCPVCQYPVCSTPGCFTGRCTCANYPFGTSCGTNSTTCTSFCSSSNACYYSVPSGSCPRTCSSGTCLTCDVCGTPSCYACGSGSSCSSGSCRGTGTACTTSCANTITITGDPLSKSCAISCSGSCTTTCPVDCSPLGSSICNGLNISVCQANSSFDAQATSSYGATVCSQASINIPCTYYVPQGCDTTCGATCNAGATQSQSCTYCSGIYQCTSGTQTKSCTGSCDWSAWSSCSGGTCACTAGQCGANCSSGQIGYCIIGGSLGTQNCTSSCTWGSCNLLSITSSVSLNPNPIAPSRPYNIQDYVLNQITQQPVSNATARYAIVSGTGVNCAAQTYPQSQILNYISSGIYCTGNGCQVESGNDPISPSAIGNYTVCVNTTATGFPPTYGSAILTVNSPSTCGNGVLDSGENCHTCPADAGCSYGQLCCQDNSCQSNCVTNGCNNNGICELFETCDCADCSYTQEGCPPGDFCDPSTGRCRCIPTSDGVCPINDPICAGQDIDCIANLTTITPRGTPDYLNIYWNTSLMRLPPPTIGLDCWLNCDPTKSSCGSAACSQVVFQSSGVCSFTNPKYQYDSYNTLYCRMYNQTSNYTYGYVYTSFKPYDVSISVSSFSVTVGQDFFLPITIRNIGLFLDSFTVNISQSNLIYTPNPVLTTNSSPSGPLLSGIPEYENSQILFNMKVLALTDSPISLLVIANSTTNTTHGNALFVQLQSGSASLPDFDIFGVFQIILLSSLAFAFLLWKKK